MKYHTRVGVYSPNNRPMYVYYNPDSHKIYYRDEQGDAHFLTGFELDTTDPDGWSTSYLDDMARYLPTGFCGIILGLSYNWLLGKDNTACKVHCGLRSDPFPFTIATYKPERA